MGIKLFFVSIFVLLSYANPYKNISVDERLVLFTNYFINESLKNKLPPKPVRAKPKEDEYNYEPTKHELNYNYVQRIKAIKESIKQEQKELNEKYRADLYRYNKKLEILHKKYGQYHNLYPIIQNSFNKALKVIYGKPVLDLGIGKLGTQFFLDTQPIYSDNNFKSKAIIFNRAEEKRMFSFYQKCELDVTFEYDQQSVLYDEVICRYNQKEYRGKIVDEDNEKIKLKIKINDDIFHKIIIKDDNE